MEDLAAALGLMLVIEGAFYALFPDAMRRMMAVVIMQPPARLRTAGLLLAAAGFVIVAWVRGMP